MDAAVYARPTVMDDGTLAFIMNDRLSHQNLQSQSLRHLINPFFFCDRVAFRDLSIGHWVNFC